MKLLSALIAVFMVSGAVAQPSSSTKVVAQPSSSTKVCAKGSVNVSCNQGYSGGGVITCNSDGYVRGAPSSWSCKDPKTGRTEKVKCKKPLKQIMPPKDRPTVMTMAKLKKACGLLDGLEDIDSNG